ncbi:sigma factor [Patulibacter sp. SYSU D01012]|uniref:sigma factor n=1 Tax=Patulibacter sp. SYSU D01012 TaxID=2817381 RepID=UPI001B30DE66|nr:sigma factor [Patulibacter sp. SYSU D01012]
MLSDAPRRDRRDLELLRRFHHDHDPTARDAMVRRALPLVQALAHQADAGAEGGRRQELIDAGAVGLRRAIDRFDPARDTRFTAFAAPVIEDEIRRQVTDTTWTAHVPRTLRALDTATARGAGDRTAADVVRALRAERAAKTA